MKGEEKKIIERLPMREENSGHHVVGLYFRTEGRAIKG